MKKRALFLALIMSMQQMSVGAEEILSMEPAESLAPIVQEQESAKAAVNVEGSETSGEEADDKPLPLRAGDRVLVKIYPEDEYIKGGEMEVSTEGNLTLPLVGKINVAGKTIPQAEKEMARIIDADYLVNPEVVIELKKDETVKMSSESVLVLGEVKKPGTYPIPAGGRNKFTLLSAISLAGGFSEIANPKRVKLVRKVQGKRETMTVNVEEIFNGNGNDIEIKNGDVVHVPESLF